MNNDLQNHILQILSNWRAEEEDRRGSAGIFYTPRLEIDLMCRLSLVDWLANHLGEEHKSLLYEAVFAYEPDEKQDADNKLMEENLWKDINSLLRQIRVLDPACGSGSFLVGMFKVLADLQARAKAQLGIPETAYERGKHIIGHSLYGVDVMPWAVQVAELRLWLQLVVEVDIEKIEKIEKRKLKARPLLSNVSFKIRLGDSLAQEAPFVWDGEKGGFDIVIGNPPYVRQEKIAPPKLRQEDHNSSQWQQLKKDYKSKLQFSVATAYPRFFNYKPGANQFRKLDGKSDLYVYFYLHGLSLLNPKGSFCFISSNSWLDVGYGKDLQEFLLKHCHVKMIIDHESKRTFAQADINTIIALLSAPDDKSPWGLDKFARFVTFKAPFESVLSPIVFQEIEAATERRILPEFRVIVRNQKELYEEGMSAPAEEDNGLQSAVYNGNKWGGKYLRAPDILFKIIEALKGKLIRLSDIAEIQYGLKTGLTEFFYIDNDTASRWNIETEFLLPILTSMQEITSPIISSEILRFKLLKCLMIKKQLKKSSKKGVLSYIEWGENQLTKKGAKHTVAGVPFPLAPSVAGNEPWYNISQYSTGDFVISSLIRERFVIAANPQRLAVSNMFYQGCIRSGFDHKLVWALLNTTLSYLFLEIYGRINIGGRLNFYSPEICPLPVIDPRIIQNTPWNKRIVEAFSVMARRNILKIDEEVKQDDRQCLDEVVLRAVGLRKISGDDIYKTLITSCQRRLEKESSLGNKN